MGFERVFLIVEDTDLYCEQMGELPTSVVSESELREQVLEAHRVLMGLNKSNELQFKDLVEALEKEKSALEGQGEAKPPRYAHGC